MQNPGTSVRARSYLYEHMFPRIRTRISPALLGRVDRLVELSTLGGYGVDEGGRLMALDPEAAAAAPSAPAARVRDDCPFRGACPPLRCDAVG